MSTHIPQPPGVPLLGNIFAVDPNNTWSSLNKLAEKHGPIFKVNTLGQQIVFIAGATLLEEICVEKRFRKAVMGLVVEIRYAVHDTLFTAYDNDPSWGIAHRIMAPLLTPTSVENSFDVLRSTSQTTFGDINLKVAMVRLFGQDIGCLNGPKPLVIRAMDEAALGSMNRPNRPRWLDFLLYQGKFARETQTMRESAANVVAKRRKNSDQRKGILHALLHGKDAETGKSFTEAQIIDEVVTLLIGTTTAPCLVSFALYYLLKNPEEIEKGRKEIEDVVGSGKLELSYLDKLPYCEAILREAFRLSAPAPGFNIEPLPSTIGPVMLASGKYEIPKNRAMIVLLHTPNRDPTIFEDPEDIEPKRTMRGRY